MTEPYQPLACELYDYLEIASLHRYRLHIELTDGSTLQGTILTTQTTADKEEFIVLQTGSEQQRLRLDQLAAITPLDDRASFGRVLLGARC